MHLSAFTLLSARLGDALLNARGPGTQRGASLIQRRLGPAGVRIARVGIDLGVHHLLQHGLNIGRVRLQSCQPCRHMGVALFILGVAGFGGIQEVVGGLDLLGPGGLLLGGFDGIVGCQQYSLLHSGHALQRG